MACSKVCKQSTDDIKVKVNILSPIPASFHTRAKNDCSQIVREIRTEADNIIVCFVQSV